MMPGPRGITLAEFVVCDSVIQSSTGSETGVVGRCLGADRSRLRSNADGYVVDYPSGGEPGELASANASAMNGARNGLPHGLRFLDREWVKFLSLQGMAVACHLDRTTPRGAVEHP